MLKRTTKIPRTIWISRVRDPRVEEGNQITVDEISLVGCPRLPGAKPIFQRRQRADPAGQFDEIPPRERPGHESMPTIAAAKPGTRPGRQREQRRHGQITTRSARSILPLLTSLFPIPDDKLPAMPGADHLHHSATHGSSGYLAAQLAAGGEDVPAVARPEDRRVVVIEQDLLEGADRLRGGGLGKRSREIR